MTAEVTVRLKMEPKKERKVGIADAVRLANTGRLVEVPSEVTDLLKKRAEASRIANAALGGLDLDASADEIAETDQSEPTTGDKLDATGTTLGVKTTTDEAAASDKKASN